MEGAAEKEAPVQVTFYGLKADAVMAATIFEVAYNSVIHLASKAMSGKGARAMLDYRCVCSTADASVCNQSLQPVV